MFTIVVKKLGQHTHQRHRLASGRPSDPLFHMLNDKNKQLKHHTMAVKADCAVGWMGPKRKIRQEGPCTMAGKTHSTECSAV
jgi:hypothetical protein